jgi:ABC-2 type transport system permease protein
MIFLGNLFAIFRKELDSYLLSPFFYVIACFFWLISGYFFIYILANLTQDAAQVDQQGVLTSGIDLGAEFLNSYFNVIISLLLVILPALSMGLYAEERKRGTLELLLTSPITNISVALGKLLSVVTIFLILWSPIIFYQSIAFSATVPPISLSTVLLANAGLILFSTAVLSLGMWISSLSENLILSYILTFILVVFLWSIDLISHNLNGSLGDFFSYISLFKNYGPFLKGQLESNSIFLLLSYIVAGVFLTTQSVEALKK